MREIEADAVGAKVGGAANLATALVKVHAYADGWQKIVEDVRFNAESLRAETNLSQPFRARAAALNADELAKTGATHVFHPTDSHPPLAERLQSLNTDLPSTLPLTAIPDFDHSSAAVIDKIEAMEATQSAELKKLVRPD